MNRQTVEDIQLFNQGMKDMGQGFGALGQAAQDYHLNKMATLAGSDMLDAIQKGGLPALDAQTLAGISQKYGLGLNGIQMTLNLLKQSGAAQKALQEYQTEIQSTRKESNQADYAAAETAKTNAEKQTVDERRPWQVADDWASVEQKTSAAKLNDANTNQVNTLTPVKVREGESRIAVNGSAANLNNTRAGDIIAKQPGEIDATKALTEQRRAAARQNEAGGKANHVGQFLQSVGVKPGTMVSNVKDGSVNFTEKYVTGRQASDIMAAAKQQGIAIEGQGVWDKAGNLTGFYMTSAVYDPATAATQRLVTKRPKAGAKPAAAPRPAAGKPVERTYDPKTRTFR